MTNDLHDIVHQIMIRNMPTIIAYELIHGQSKTKEWRRRSSGEYVVYKTEIAEWIISQDMALWERADHTFTFTEEMEVLFLLRWS